MLSKEQAYAIIDQVVLAAKGYDVRVMVQDSGTGLTRFANSEIHQNVFEDSTQVVVNLSRGKKRINFSTALIDEAGLQETVRDMIDNLEFLPEGQEEPPLVSEPAVMETVDFNDQLDCEYGVYNRARLVKQCLDMLDPAYKAFGALSYDIVQMAFGNSTGIKRFARGNTVSFSALVADSEGGSGYSEITSNRPQDFDVLAAFSRAYDKARMNKNPAQIEPGPYTVILEQAAVGDIVQYMAFIGFSGKSLQNQASFLTGKMGEQVFDTKLTIIDDHTNPNTVSLPFDFEGTPRQRVAIIENGVAKGVVHDMASAQEAGVESTGHSVNMPHFGGIPLNIVVEGGEQTLDEIIKDTADGILVTRFHYMNPVNPREAVLTALTRDGVFRIEDGKIVGAVKNMRFTDSMLKAFSSIEAISSDRARTRSFFGNYYVPALKIKDLRFTGKTNA